MLEWVACFAMVRLANEARLPPQAQACTQKQTYLLLVCPPLKNGTTVKQAERQKTQDNVCPSCRLVVHIWAKKGGGKKNRNNRRKGTDAKQKKRRISPQPLEKKQKKWEWSARIEEKRIKKTETNTKKATHLNTTKKVAGENAFRYVVGLISFSVAETYLETSFQL